MIKNPCCQNSWGSSAPNHPTICETLHWGFEQPLSCTKTLSLMTVFVQGFGYSVCCLKDRLPNIRKKNLLLRKSWLTKLEIDFLKVMFGDQTKRWCFEMLFCNPWRSKHWRFALPQLDLQPKKTLIHKKALESRATSQFFHAKGRCKGATSSS